jgi:hypothetical protein
VTTFGKLPSSKGGSSSAYARLIPTMRYEQEAQGTLRRIIIFAMGKEAMPHHRFKVRACCGHPRRSTRLGVSSGYSGNEWMGLRRRPPSASDSVVPTTDDLMDHAPSRQRRRRRHKAPVWLRRPASWTPALGVPDGSQQVRV